MNPQDHADVIVVGLGALGSATAFHLAKRGARVLALDQFQPPHNRGSSHGQTRIIREAYFEHPCYVPLVQRAYELWFNLEKATGARLFQQTSGIMIGPTDGLLVGGSRKSALQHHIKFEELRADEIRRRFPAIHPTGDMRGILEPRAGILFPEKCIDAHLRAADRAGAVLKTRERVCGWRAGQSGVSVRTDQAEYTAAQLFFSVGSWTNRLVPELRLPLRIERQIQFWFAPRRPSEFTAERLPIFICEYEPTRFFYAFPDLGQGFKIAKHHEGATADPDTLDRTVTRSEEEEMRSLLRRFVPEADGPLLATEVCMYTNTPDGHFLIDRHPAHAQVLIGSACSGHGFKFSSVMGEIAADLLLEGKTSLDVSRFRLRFG